MSNFQHNKPLPKAWDCQACDATNYFGRYAFAHWNERLAATCTECGQSHVAQAGRVTIVRKSKTK